MIVWPVKHPLDNDDYDLVWSGRLGGDTIATSSWSILETDGLLTLGATSFISSVTKAWFSGGTHGQDYLLRNTITTNGGDTLTEKVLLPVRDK